MYVGVRYFYTGGVAMAATDANVDNARQQFHLHRLQLGLSAKNLEEQRSNLLVKRDAQKLQLAFNDHGGIRWSGELSSRQK